MLYLGLSVGLLGRLVLGDIGTTTIGSGPDPAAFVWILRWWPHAVASGWDPLHTTAAYAPDGFNMTWVTSIPGPSLALAPLTQLVGPIVSYNVLIILTPAINGWAAFLLCRELDAGYLASLLGGYVFGFSSYVLGQAPGHPHAALVAALPLATLLAVRFQRQKISRRWFIAAMSATLTAQFLVSVEVFLTMTMFGALAIALAMWFFREQRSRVMEPLKSILVAYLITLAIVSPYLYANLSKPSTIAGIEPLTLSTDPIGVLVPSHLTEIGGALFEPINSQFAGEQGAYLGVPLFLLLCLFAWQRRRDRVFRYLFTFLLLAFIATLGPRLDLLGHVTTIRLPWTPFIHLPIFKYIIPARLFVYVWLALTVVIALGLSFRPVQLSRWALAMIGAVLLLPATGATNSTDGEPFWSSARHVPAFFRSAQLHKLPREGTVLVLPYAVADNGESMLWQAEADMAFKMPDGYLSAVVPPSFSCWPVDGSLRASSYSATQRRQFLAFLASKQVRAVVVSAQERQAAQPLLSALPGRPWHAGGVYVYRVVAGGDARNIGKCPAGAR